MKSIHWMPLIGIVLLACIFPVQGAPDDGPGFVANQMDITLSLMPAEAEIGMNETTTYDVVGVCNPPGAMNETACIDSYNITVSLDDGMVGEIMEIAFPEDVSMGESGTVPGDSVWVTAQNLTPPAAAAENQTLFTVTVRGDAAGTTGVTLTPDMVVDGQGGTPTVTTVPANLTVTGEAGQTIYETAVADGNFTTLVTALDLTGLNATLDEPGTYTVFAPTDAAFANLPAGVLDSLLNDTGALENVLLYHVAGETYTAADIAGMTELQTLLGENVTVTVDEANGTVMINDAMVTAADIECTNGIVHVIDTVLIPPEPAGLEANFSADVTEGEAPLNVQFTDLSTGDVTVWYWDFGDGAFSTEQNPAHMYNTSGTFNVNLTVSDDTGASDSLEMPDYINVSEAPPVIVPEIFFEPQNASVDVGGTVEYALILNTAPDGLAGYTLNVDSGTEGVAEIVNVSYPDWAMPTNTSALPDTTVEIKAGDMMDNITAGATNVSLANITVLGVMEGQANLSVEVVRMTADGGGPIMPDMMTAAINVTPIATPPTPFPGYENPPTDPNNDGKYEDVNGNGEIEYDDVIALNTNMQWVEENNLVPLFDFNNNGKVDYDDIVMLFDMI
ncbi:fasciclin domain-containing protein [Methanofollis sp. UBA420]|uniref:fasciclin domain-containing protein n=1 Tax=Methanofollis sp. UBA420 TaxID=1915514 RepID=UPI00316AD609